jgi:hypothetical protein
MRPGASIGAGRTRVALVADKSRQKSREERRAAGKFARGTAQGPGRGPKKGAPNAGRPRDEFKQSMRAIADRAVVLTRLRKLTSTANTDDELFLKALKETADRGYGKAAQGIELAGPDGGPIPIASAAEIRDGIARDLASLAARRDQK